MIHFWHYSYAPRCGWPCIWSLPFSSSRLLDRFTEPWHCGWSYTHHRSHSQLSEIGEYTALACHSVPYPLHVTVTIRPAQPVWWVVCQRFIPQLACIYHGKSVDRLWLAVQPTGSTLSNRQTIQQFWRKRKDWWFITEMRVTVTTDAPLQRRTFRAWKWISMRVTVPIRCILPNNSVSVMNHSIIWNLPKPNANGIVRILNSHHDCVCHESLCYLETPWMNSSSSSQVCDQNHGIYEVLPPIDPSCSASSPHCTWALVWSSRYSAERVSSESQEDGTYLPLL